MLGEFDNLDDHIEAEEEKKMPSMKKLQSANNIAPV